MAAPGETRLLTRSEIRALMSPEDYLEGVEYAFRMHGQGKSFGTTMLHGETPGDLEFHIKAGGLFWQDRKYYGLKINGSSFSNKELRGLPNILGAILLFDGDSGFPGRHRFRRADHKENRRRDRCGDEISGRARRQGHDRVRLR